MPKKASKRSYKRNSRGFATRKFLLIGAFAGLLGISVIPGFSLKSHPLISSAHQPSTTLEPYPPAAAPAPKPTTSPPPPAKTAIHKTTTKRVAVAKAQPAVTPSPAANVSGLAPVPPASGGGSGQGSGSGGQAVGYTSTNWSGYLTTSGSFTNVSGSWKVPTALGISGTTSADSTWVGIGGVTAGDLIQTGTDNIISASGQVTTQAWYEVLPQASIPIPSLTVKPGDDMTASVAETSTNQWLVTIIDTTTNQSFSINLSYASSHSSAEWVEEDPSSFRGLIPLDNFQTTTFTTGQAVTSGTSVSLSNSQALPVTMVNKSGQTIALPSALSGNGFSVTRTGL